MKTIKGLIIKDLLQLKTYKRTLIIFIIVFVATSIAQENTRNMLVILMTLGLGMFSIATFSYDEMAKADKYILTLPLTRKEVVLSKYILVIIATIVGAIFGVLATIILSFVRQEELVNFQELIILAISGIFGIGMVEAIQIPCIYKYGAEKGRIQIFIFLAILAFVVGGIVFVGEKMNVNFLTNDRINVFMNFLPIILIIVTILIYFISYKVSYKIFCKKEI